MKKQPPLLAQRPHFTSCDSEVTVLFAEVPTHLHAVARRHSRPPVICVKCPKCDVVIEPGMDGATIQAVLSAGSVAHVIEQRFLLSVPLYRQEKYWRQQGVPLSRQTMDNWLIEFIALLGKNADPDCPALKH